MSYHAPRTDPTASAGSDARRASLDPSSATARDAHTNGSKGRYDEYDIAHVLTDPRVGSSGAPLAFLPSLPSLSQQTYLPTQLTSLGTAFTSAGTLPRSSTPGAKQVAQRRSQAPALVQTELRKVASNEFDAYLDEIRQEYDSWARETRTNTLESHDDDDQDRDDDDNDDDDDDASLPRRTASSSKRKKRRELESLPPLDQVPAIFFDPAFNLSNPRTFDLVTDRIQLTPVSSPALTFSPRIASTMHHDDDDHDRADDLVVPGVGPTTLNDLASDQLLQEKLSHFTAVIESHLVREIGLRSSSFFAALSNLQHLHEQGTSALTKIEQLEAKLADPDRGVNGTARHGLAILRLQARRRGLERIEESVRAVDEVASALRGVQELVENGEWSDALEVAETIQEAYERSALPPPLEASPPSPLSPAASAARRSSSAPSTDPPPLNLTKIAALRSIPVKLSLVRAQVAKSLEGELISVLEHEMDVGIEARVERRRRKAVKALDDDDDDDDADESGGPPRDREIEDGDIERIRERTRPVVKALVKSEGMDSAIQAWRESVLREIRAMVREHLPTGGSAGDQEEEDPFASAAVRAVSKQSIDLGTISDKSLSLAKKLRAMSHESFLRLAQDTYVGLLACIEAVDMQSRILLELVSQSREEESMRKSRRRATVNGDHTTLTLAVPGTAAGSPLAASPSPFVNPAVDEAGSSISTEITDVVAAVTELANVRFSKVIGVRSEVHSQLSLAEFLDVFDASWQFVLECETLVKRMIVGLRGAMVSQSKQWLVRFHQTRINENAKLVEEEQWSASEVPLEVQKKVELIVQGAMVDPPELLLGQRLKSDASVVVVSGETAPLSEERPPQARQVEIEGRQFFAVSAGLSTINTLVDYVQVVLNCPMLTTDAMTKVIEFMKVFNSRSCQVVLGAGAMRSAGLKNITAKNLALASQALSIMVSLIPYIRELIRRHLSAKQAVMLTEFDKLKRDYQEHQNEIHFKLVAIMSDRLIVHSRTLDTLDWEQPSSKPGQPNAYMEALVKEHLTLYKVLSRFLHVETVFAIMSQVFKALDTKLGEEYSRIDLKSEDAKERVLVDVRYLQEKLGSLKGLEENGPGKSIETLVQAKSLPVKSVPTLTSASSSVDAAAASPTKDSASTLRPPPAAIETPLPATPSLWTSLPPSASTSALSLALPDAPSTPRTSLDAPPSNYSPPVPPRNRSPSPGPQPPSPVPVPAPLPPSPKPGPAPYKKKSLAERLAERMGRKPVEAVPPQQPSRSSLDVASEGATASRSGQVESAKDEDDKLLRQVQEEIPVWTPKGEKELEEVEKEVEEQVKAEGLGIVSSEADRGEVSNEPAKQAEAGGEPETQDLEVESENAQDGDKSTPEEPTETPTSLDPLMLDESIPEETSAVPAADDSTDTIDDPLTSTVTSSAQVPEEASTDPSHIESAALPVATVTEAPSLPADTGNAPTTLAGSSTEVSPVPVDEEHSRPATEEKVDAVSPTQGTGEAPAQSTEAPDLPALHQETVVESQEPAVERSVTLKEPLQEESRAPDLPPAISIPSAADVAAPRSAPTTPIASPTRGATSPVSSVAEIASTPPAVAALSSAATSDPPRKKTLKERLAEAARRGSTGSSLVNVTSPPPADGGPPRQSLELSSTTLPQVREDSSSTASNPTSVAPSDHVPAAAATMNGTTMPTTSVTTESAESETPSSDHAKAEGADDSKL